jgi:hypothetical protein
LEAAKDILCPPKGIHYPNTSVCEKKRKYYGSVEEARALNGLEEPLKKNLFEW